MENHHFFYGKTHYKWWFSIVMLNYQRVITVKPWKICLKCKKMRKLMKLIYNVKDLESNYIMVQKWHPFEQDLCIHFYFMFHLMVCLDVSWRVYNNSMCVQWIDSSERMRWHDGSSYTHSGFCLSELTNNNDIANWRVCFCFGLCLYIDYRYFLKWGCCPVLFQCQADSKKVSFAYVKP